VDELERREAARDELARMEPAQGDSSRPETPRPGAYELAHVDEIEDGPSPTMRRRRLLVGIVAVVAIVALALAAIGVGSVIFLIR
jgi:hypothetical protein